jgi:hypothetical protein
LKNQTGKAILKIAMQDEPTKMICPARKWTKRAGIIAFFFFLGKGLVWLGAIAAGAYYTFN